MGGLTGGCSGCRKRRRSVAAKRDEAIAEKIVERAMRTASGGKADVDISGDTVRITSDEGSMVISGGADAQVPSNLPGDVPIYKGAGVLQSMTKDENEFSLMLQSSDDMSKVVDYYKAVMKAKGWGSEGTVDMPGRWMQVHVKGTRAVSVIVAGADGKTIITIVGGVKK